MPALAHGTALRYAVARAIRTEQIGDAYAALTRAYPAMPLHKAAALIGEVRHALHEEADAAYVAAHTDPY